MKSKYFFIGFLIALTFFIVFLEFCERNDRPIPKSITRIDTLVKVVPPETIRIERIKPKVKLLRDTIIYFKPFVASFDTVYRRDSISAIYHFPEQEMDLFIRKASDTIIIPLLLPKSQERQNIWWEKPLVFATGIVIGWMFTKK